jgi:hypothetical protein
VRPLDGTVTYLRTRDSAERAEEPGVQNDPKEQAESIVDEDDANHSCDVTLRAVMVGKHLNRQKRLNDSRQREAGEAEELSY